MANITDRLPANTPGRYYVDASCIDCDQCRSLAPGFFSRDEDLGLSIVHRQPESDEERALIEDVMTGCATSSIGNDGE